MTGISTLIYFGADTLDKENEFISTGGIHPVYFLGAVLFMILIMIALLVIRITNLKHNEAMRNKNKQV